MNVLRAQVELRRRGIDVRPVGTGMFTVRWPAGPVAANAGGLIHLAQVAVQSSGPQTGPRGPGGPGGGALRDAA